MFAARTRWKNRRVRVSNVRTVETFAPNAAQRRLLVELLAAELDGDVALRLGPARLHDATLLAGHGFVARSAGWVSLTPAGRTLADRLSARMLGLTAALA